jgi:hypothetical protein
MFRFFRTIFREYTYDEVKLGIIIFVKSFILLEDGSNKPKHLAIKRTSFNKE